jgi:hypothetical protein
MLRFQQSIIKTKKSHCALFDIFNRMEHAVVKILYYLQFKNVLDNNQQSGSST